MKALALILCSLHYHQLRFEWLYGVPVVSYDKECEAIIIRNLDCVFYRRAENKEEAGLHEISFQKAKRTVHQAYCNLGLIMILLIATRKFVHVPYLFMAWR